MVRRARCRSPARCSRNWPSGDLFGLTQNAGMGWTASEVARDPVPDPQHPGRPPRGRRPADRAGIPHGPLGDRPAGPGGGRGAAAARTSCRSRGWSPTLRRPDAGHDRHDGQPALSQRRRDRLPAADPLAAASQRCARHRHLRQGPAGDDDGAGRVRAPAVRARPRRRDPAARDGEDAGKVQSIGRGSPTASSRWPRPPSWAAAPAAVPAAAASSSGRPPPRRSSPRRSA